MTEPDLTSPAEPAHAEVHRKLRALQDLLAGAKAMPMSASCVVNRSEALALVDAAIAAVPEEAAAGPESGSEAEAVLADARERAATMVSHSSIVTEAEAEAERIVAAAREEAEGLRTETDGFVDQRMASFESVLHKTLSQVQLARTRLSERSGLDRGEE